MKSENDVYIKALERIDGLGINLKSFRMARYYSCQGILDNFSENTRYYHTQKEFQNKKI